MDTIPYKNINYYSRLQMVAADIYLTQYGECKSRTNALHEFNHLAMVVVQEMKDAVKEALETNTKMNFVEIEIYLHQQGLIDKLTPSKPIE